MTSFIERLNHLVFGEQKHHWNLVRDFFHPLYDATYPNVAYPPIPVASDNVVWGIDISHWDGPVDLQVAKDRGCSFVIVKIADGTIQTRWSTENVSSAIALHIPVIGYCWLYRNVRISGRAQGTAWSNIAKKLGLKYVVVDFEPTRWGGLQDNPNTSDLSGAVIPFEQAFGSKPLIYSSPGYMNSYFNHDVSWKAYQWWQAQYAVLHPSPVVPWGLNGHTLWQVTDKWDGSQLGVDPHYAKQVDGNLFNGTLQQLLDTFAPDILPPPADVITMPFPGVKVTRGRRFDSDIQVVEIMKNSVEPKLTSVIAQGRCDIVENIFGDIVSNGGDFNKVTCVPIGLLNSQGVQVAPQSGFEPAFGLNLDGSAEIDHRRTSWPNAVGLKRYIVENGLVSPNTSPEWNSSDPRKIYGVKQNGDTIILSVQGWVPNQTGHTLFQSAAVMIEFGAWTAGDGDGGYSVQTRIGSEVFTSTPNRHDEVADFVSFKIKQGGTMTQVIQGTVKGKLTIRDGPAGNATGKYLYLGDTIEAFENSVQWLHLSKINGSPVVGTQWASAGASMQYIQWAWVLVDPLPPPPPPPPPPDTNIVLDIDATMTQTDANGVVIATYKAIIAGVPFIKQ